jgi:hypothetical protein
MASAAALKKMKPVINKIELWYQNRLQAVVKSDCGHVSDYFRLEYGSAVAKSDLVAKVSQAIPESPGTLKTVPAQAETDVVFHLTAYRWDSQMSVKGTSRMPDIWEKFHLLFPGGLRSSDEKILCYFGSDQRAHAPILHQSVQVRNGMSKLIACWMVAVAVAEGVLTPAEVALLQPVIATFGQIHTSWDGEHSLANATYSSIGIKMARSLTQRIDPDQMLQASKPIILEKKAADAAQGVEHTMEEYIDICTNEYNNTLSSDAPKVDHHERSATKWLAQQDSDTQAAVQECWSEA